MSNKCTIAKYLLLPPFNDVGHLLDDFWPFILEPGVDGIPWTSRWPALLHHRTNNQLQNVVDTRKPQWFAHCPFDEQART